MHFNVYFNEILRYIFLIKLYETIYQSKLFLTLTHLCEFEVNAAVKSCSLQYTARHQQSMGKVDFKIATFTHSVALSNRLLIFLLDKTYLNFTLLFNVDK